MVLSKLLTHGHGGSTVNEEASGNGLPLLQSTGTSLGLDLLGIEACAQEKIGKKLVSRVSGTMEFIGRRMGIRQCLWGLGGHVGAP